MIDKEIAEKIVNDAQKFPVRLIKYLQIQFPGIQG